MNRAAFTVITGVVLSVSTAPVMAAENGSFSGLEEIVVTAQKRTERLQDVPLSITALSAMQLEKLGADGFTDYARTIPGLSFIDRGPGRNKITIRGISTGVDQNNQSPVGIYFDDTPVSMPSNEPDLRLFDIERVEVLRGPQGTLYGAGSMGGTIKIIANKPDPTSLQGRISSTASSTRLGGENYRVNGMINVPVVDDKAAIRAVGYYRKEDGYVDNVQLGQSNVNDDETYGGRLSAKWLIAPNFDVTATAFLQRTELGGTQETAPGLGELRQARAVPEIRDDDFEQYNVTMRYDMPWAELVSSSSYYEREVREVRDVTAFLRMGATVALDNTVPMESFSQEIRLTSPGTGRLQWIGGAFYSDLKDDLIQAVPHGPIPGLPADILLLDSRIDNSTKQLAFFGELSYELVSQLKATVGVRWFDVDQEFSLESRGLIAGGHRIDDGGSSERSANPKFGLSWAASDGLLFYAQAAQGFRVGGPNNTLPPDPISGAVAPSQYDSDSLWNYELGVKSEFADRRVVLNAAVFHIDWTDIQVGIVRPDGFSYVANAGKASSRGGELELATRFVDDLELNAGVSYVDAQLEKDAPSLNGEEGDRIPAVPRLTYSMLARYHLPFGRQWLDTFLQADLQHVGESYNAFNTTTADLQHSYDIVNAKIDLMVGRWNIGLFADNVLDKRAELFVDTLLGDKRVNISRPRTIGVSVQLDF